MPYFEDFNVKLHFMNVILKFKLVIIIKKPKNMIIYFDETNIKFKFKGDAS